MITVFHQLRFGDRILQTSKNSSCCATMENEGFLFLCFSLLLFLCLWSGEMHKEACLLIFILGLGKLDPTMLPASQWNLEPFYKLPFIELEEILEYIQCDLLLSGGSTGIYLTNDIQDMFDELNTSFAGPFQWLATYMIRNSSGCIAWTYLFVVLPSDPNSGTMKNNNAIPFKKQLFRYLKLLWYIFHRINWQIYPIFNDCS